MPSNLDFLRDHHLIVDVESGVNDYLDRDGSRTPIRFHISNDHDNNPIDAEVVQAATKWKRMALEAFRAQPEKFDLVITDQAMPNMTGAELAPKLLGIRADVPIILCTGFSEVISEEAAKAIGIRDYVMKPVVQTQIAKTIRRVLDKD